MESSNVKDILKKAAEAVQELPEHLQVKAFELAVSMLSGQAQNGPQHSAPIEAPAERSRVVQPATDTEAPEVSDLLRVCKRNPDRYLIFMQDMEHKSEDASTASLVERFRIYRQDTPKLPARDLGDMIAKGLIEQVGKGRDSTFVLKRKGRERLAELSTALNQ